MIQRLNSTRLRVLPGSAQDTFPGAPSDPAEETIRGLQTWPDSALFRLAADLAAELHRRRLPQPAALPVTAAASSAIGAALRGIPQAFEVTVF